MDSQYYYKLMASYLSKRNCDESFMRYFFGKNLKKTSEELEKADERKRRLQRERSRRYRALKNARRQNEGGSRDSTDCDNMRSKSHTLLFDDEFSDCDDPPTLCDLNYDDKWRENGQGSSDCPSDDNSGLSAAELKEAAMTGNVSISLKEFLSSPNAELDYQTVHSLMFHWLQT